MPHPLWKQKVQEIFGSQKVPEVTSNNLKTFRDHLRSNLEEPCYLFISSDDGAQFEAVLLVDYLEDVDHSKGILVTVKRTSDDKAFTVPLAQLECPPEDTDNHSLVEAYSSWFIRSVFQDMWTP
ncbi:MAG: hypothetical protein R6V55_02895 [Desulfovermiculus sp.]